MVRNSLSVLLLLEKLRPSCLHHLPPSTRLTRTLLTFLIGIILHTPYSIPHTPYSILHLPQWYYLYPGNDIFMEEEVRPYLSALLTSVYCSKRIQQTLDLSLSSPGLPSFYELLVTLQSHPPSLLPSPPSATSLCWHSLQLCLTETLSSPATSSFLSNRGSQSLSAIFSGNNIATLSVSSLSLFIRSSCVVTEYDPLIKPLYCMHQLPVDVESFLLPLETDKHLLQLYIGAVSQNAVQWALYINHTL